jgi:glycerophosphoryl diester phosphodiesterase
VSLLRAGHVLRIGHRGAPALAPENTLESIAAAIEMGVDLVEIDVVSTHGVLRVAHSVSAVGERSPTFGEALDIVRESGAGVIVDVKPAGIEEAVVAELRGRELLRRAVFASFRPATARAVKALEPRLTTALSYPFDRAGIAERPAFQPLIRAGLAGVRRVLPARIGGMLRRAGADAATLHWALVSRALVERCHARDKAVLAWTVEDASALRAVLAAGVDGVVANDPGLFDV